MRRSRVAGTFARIPTEITTMTTNTNTNEATVNFAIDGDTMSLIVAALVQTAHYAKESRDTAAETAGDKANDQNIINASHALIGRLLIATAEQQGPLAALAIEGQINELWHGLVGEMPTTNETEATA